MGTRRVDLKVAASELGITSEAVRRRAKRGTLPSENGEDGRLYVWLPAVSDSVSDGVSDSGPHTGESDNRREEALLERFEDENEFLRRELERLHRELERKDTILMSLVQRVPELEPASEPRESSETVAEEEDKVEPPEQEERSSWWRKLLFR